MRIPHLITAMLLSAVAWAQLPFSFSGSAGGDCAPQVLIAPWPGTAVPSNAVQFNWSATNATASPAQLTISVYRDAYLVGQSLVPANVEHTFTVTAAPNTTTIGTGFWPCAATLFEFNRAHSVRVSGPAGTCTSFSMTVSLGTPVFADDAEGNNSSGTGPLVTLNTDYDGHLHFNGNTDDDWYRIQLPSQGKLVITLQSETPASAPSTIEAHMIYTTGTTINTWSGPTGTNNAPNTNVFEQTCRGGSTGTYYLRIRASGGCDISYRLTVTLVTPAFANDPTTAGSSVAYNTYQDGQLEFDFPNNTNDYFNIAPPTNGVMSIEVQAEHAGATQSTLQVQLKYTTGTVIQTWTVPSGANGVPITTMLSIPCRGNTTTYNVAFTSAICGASYRFKYTVAPPFFTNDTEPNNSAGQSIVLPEGQTAQGQINFDTGDNADSYLANLSSDGVMNVTIEAEHADVGASGLITVELYVSSGTVLQTWTAPVGTNSTPISTALSKTCRGNTGPYYLRVSSTICGTSYRISYSATPPLFAQDVEPNNSVGQAIVLPETQTAQGHMNFYFGDNNDEYRADLSGDGVMNVTIEAEHADVSTTGLVTVDLFISNGTVLQTWTAPVGASSVAMSTSFSKTCRGNGLPYYLRVSSDICGTSYRISYSLTPPFYANDPEPNNSTPGTLMNLNAANQQGHIGFYNTTDDEYYAFTHPGGPWSITVSAEHAGTGAGTMSMVVINNPGTVFGTFTVPVGGSSAAVTNTFTIPSLPAGTIYRVRLSDVTCGVSYRLHCYDADNDGTCNAFDLCAGGPEPGTPCNDNTACTTNDVILANCSCAGTPVDPNDNNPCTLDSCDPINGVSNVFQDADADGTCDANDLCPGGPEPGTVCNDNDACTTGDVIGTNCLCAGTFADADADGTCDANDLCPGGPEPGTACNDNNACTTGDVIGTNCLCAGTFADADADGTCDANDLCPGGPEPGTACNDINACTTGDVIGANCLCAGTFADADADGTCDANDLCPGGPEPGTLCNDNNTGTINDIIQANCVCAGTLLGNDCNGVPGGPAVPGTSCNDNDACTTGDVFDANCLCTGTFADADADGTCDANDLCPGGPEPGTACNDNNVCTIGDVIGANCLCTGTFQDADADGTCDANDLCPGGPEPGTSCNDNNACTTGDMIGANCLCAGTVQDTDGDGVCNANDNCPTVPGQIGSACNDGNANTTGDALNTSCQCVGTPIAGCTENLTLSVKLDGNPTQTTWTLLDAATETVTISSGGFTAGQANTTVVVPICVPVGCYHLRVNDSGSNGITNGGYVLRDASSRRIIDASLGSFSSVSQINSGTNPNRFFCLPISNIGMQTTTSCDKVRPRTSPIYANTQPGATGYQFWIYDPHGTYNRRVLKTTNQLVPASLVTSPVPSNLDLNVRVRSLTGTVYSEFGPACRIRFTGGVVPAMGEGHSRGMEEARTSEVPLTIYPNPNRDGQLTISMEGLEIADGANVDVVIYDLLGKPVVTETAPVAEGMLSYRMDLAGRIGQGIYVVNVIIDGKLYTERLVMQ